MQNQPPSVPLGATQGGADPKDTQRRARWPWVEASVWTDRMLAALENGVKGGVWFSLIDKVYKRANLWSAWCKTARNKGSAGVDPITIGQFEREAERNEEHLAEQLRQGAYQPKPIRRSFIPKPDGESFELGTPSAKERGWGPLPGLPL